MEINEKLLNHLIENRKQMLTEHRARRNEIDENVYYELEGIYQGFIEAYELIIDLMNTEL